MISQSPLWGLPPQRLLQGFSRISEKRPKHHFACTSYGMSLLAGSQPISPNFHLWMVINLGPGVWSATDAHL